MRGVANSSYWVGLRLLPSARLEEKVSVLETIVVVAPDFSMRRSLTFALQAEGFGVMSFDSPGAARDAITSADYVIVDERSLGKEPCQESVLEAAWKKTIILTKTPNGRPECPVGAQLQTPFQGSELLALLTALRGG